MFIHVQELLTRREPVALEGSLDVSGLFHDSRDIKALGPLEYRLTAQGIDGRITVSGELKCRIRHLCSRCLKPVDMDLAFPYEEYFRVMKEAGPEPDEEDDFVPVTEDKIDLRPFLEAELVLNLPLAPLCDENCKGICPECGTNRNEQSCACKAERIDPRLEALKNWFESQ